MFISAAVFAALIDPNEGAFAVVESDVFPTTWATPIDSNPGPTGGDFARASGLW